MELTTKITSKGQVTIPVTVRRKLGVKAGERVVFVFHRPGEVSFRRAAPAAVPSSRGALVGKTNGRVATVGELREAAVAGATRSHPR